VDLGPGAGDVAAHGEDLQPADQLGRAGRPRRQPLHRPGEHPAVQLAQLLGVDRQQVLVVLAMVLDVAPDD
jgi:hypothetical protein